MKNFITTLITLGTLTFTSSAFAQNRQMEKRGGYNDNGYYNNANDSYSQNGNSCDNRQGSYGYSQDYSRNNNYNYGNARSNDYAYYGNDYNNYDRMRYWRWKKEQERRERERFFEQRNRRFRNSCSPY